MAASTSLPYGQEPSQARASRRGRLGPSLALGVTLARRGPLAVVSMVVSAVTAVVLAVVALGFARRGGDAPVESMPVLASSAIAWGGGFLQAVAVAAGALRRDRTDGIRALFIARTTSVRGYLAGRIGGLVGVLAAVVGGGTLLVSVIAILGAVHARAVGQTFQATVGALLYAVAFAGVVAPVAFAALGARSRISGYFFLLLVLVVPELVASTLSTALPNEVTELCAIPSALAALRSSVAFGAVDPLRLLRALVALGVFVAAAVLFVRRDALVVARETP